MYGGVGVLDWYVRNFRSILFYCVIVPLGLYFPWVDGIATELMGIIARAHGNSLTGEDAWGKGIVSGAIQALCKWAFETNPELERLFAEPFARNGASRRVLEKNGFEMDCIL